MNVYYKIIKLRFSLSTAKEQKTRVVNRRRIDSINVLFGDSLYKWRTPMT
jgi:hypothetical protein